MVMMRVISNVGMMIEEGIGFGDLIFLKMKVSGKMNSVAGMKFGSWGSGRGEIVG